MTGPDSRSAKRWLKPLAGVAVLAAHLAVFALIYKGTPAPEYAPAPLILLELTRPVMPAVETPDPLPKPAIRTGGGAPAAPSRVHLSASPPAVPPEVTAPATPAPEPAPVVGASASPGIVAGQGQGGQGTGTGGGSGAGVGPGSGVIRARLTTAPTPRDLSRLHPAGEGSRTPGRATVSCRIRLDSRLDGCRIVSEAPSAQGYGQAALRAADLYRFQPPSREGRAEAGDITLMIEFGIQAR